MTTTSSSLFPRRLNSTQNNLSSKFEFDKEICGILKHYVRKDKVKYEIFNDEMQLSNFFATRKFIQKITLQSAKYIVIE